MTVYVGTDFLLALAKDSDWLQSSAEDALGEHEVETSTFSYLELVLVRDEQEKQVVLKAVNYYTEGMTAFGAFHAATTETRSMDVLSSETSYDDIEVARVPLEPTDEK